MTKAIEVVYEDNVFKPLVPVKGFKEHERMVATLSPRPKKIGLRDLAGTLSYDEARVCRNLLIRSFKNVEGTWQVTFPEITDRILSSSVPL